MTVRVSKPKFNLREKITELDKPSGLKGTELMRSETSQEVRDLIGADRRNLVINGAMMVAQRGTSSTSKGYHTVDRFYVEAYDVDENPTQAQVDVSSGTTPYTNGFRKALKITNGNQTNGAGNQDLIVIFYTLEAQDIANSGWNYTSPSSFITLSFWIKSSVAQNFYGRLYSYDGTPQGYAFETGSLSANTWTKVTKTIPGNSNLTFDNNVNAGLYIEISAFRGTGGTGSMSLNQWGTYNSNIRTPDQTSTWYTTNDATLEVTGLQLEVGNIATEFEHRSFGEELQLCRRYYFKPDMDNVLWPAYQYHQSHKMSVVQFPVQMRAVPTCTATWGNTSNAFTQYYLSKDHFKAYNGSGYADNNSFYLNSFEAEAEL